MQFTATIEHSGEVFRFSLQETVEIALPLSPALFGEANAAHESVEVRVGTQGVQAGIYFQIQKPRVVRIVGFIEPFERFLLPPKPGVDKSDLVPAHAIGLYVLLQLRNGL